MGKTKERDPNKLGVGRLLIWKSSDVSQAAVQAIVLGFLTLYCTDTLGINPAVLGTLLLASKIVGGSILINMLFPIVMSKLATSRGGWITTIAIFMIPLTLIGVLRFIFIKEDPSVDAGQQYQKVSLKEIFMMFRKNKYVWLYAGIMLCYNIMTALGVGTYYYKWVIGNMGLMAVTSVFSIVTLPLMFSFPAIMKKIGTMGNMIAAFCGIGVVGYLIAFLSNDNLVGVVAGTMIGSIAGLPLAYYGVLFIMKCCTYNEMQGLPRMDGSSNILANFTSKVGSAVTGFMLGLSGYVYGDNVTAQPGSAVMMIRVLFAIVPAISLVLIGICAKKFVKLEQQIPEWEEQKKARLAAEAENG